MEKFEETYPDREFVETGGSQNSLALSPKVFSKRVGVS